MDDDEMYNIIEFDTNDLTDTIYLYPCTKIYLCREFLFFMLVSWCVSITVCFIITVLFIVFHLTSVLAIIFLSINLCCVCCACFCICGKCLSCCCKPIEIYQDLPAYKKQWLKNLCCRIIPESINDVRSL